jgi:hypothetical protein
MPDKQSHGGRWLCVWHRRAPISVGWKLGFDYSTVEPLEHHPPG